MLGIPWNAMKFNGIATQGIAQDILPGIARNSLE
jgi:hypothetical protein